MRLANAKPVVSFMSDIMSFPSTKTLPLGYFFLVALAFLEVTSAGTGCWDRGDRKYQGSAYDGTQSKTKGGFTCQNWSAQYPQIHVVYPSKYSRKGIGNHNYCRNPQENYYEPWCYTTNPNKRWDFCEVPTCGIGCWPGKDRKLKGPGYTGKQSLTRRGYTCQKWSTQSPNSHSYYQRKFFDEGIGDHNYCRNPDEKYSDVWCYTTSHNERWDWCDVPTCSGCDCTNVNEDEYTLKGVEYDLKSGAVKPMPPANVGNKVIRNRASEKQMTKFVVTYTKTDARSFTHTAGASVTIGTKFQAKVPLVAEAEVSASLTASYSFSAGSTKTTTELVSAEFWCYGAAFKETECDVFLFKDKMTVPYKSTWTNKYIADCECVEEGVFEQVAGSRMEMNTVEKGFLKRK